MKQLTICLVFFIICNGVFGQTITGKIMDTDNNPIPYATLQIGPNYGVITNEEGVFNLETDAFSDTDTVSISCLGYKSKTFKLSDFNKETYILEPSINELSEVFITNKELSVEEILDRVKANISKNYTSEGRQRIFKRQSSNFKLQDFDFDVVKSTNLKKAKIKDFNKKFDSIKGSVINKTSKYFEDVLLDVLNTADSLQIAVIKATKLVNIDKDLSTDAINGKAIKNALAILDSTSTYKLKSGLFTLEDSLKVGNLVKDSTNSRKGETKALKTQLSHIIKANTLNENSNLDFIFETDRYDYNIEGISYLDEDATYIISFKPDARKAKYTGKMYVNTSDFAVVKLNYQFAENKSGKKLNLKLLLGVKFEENAYSSTVIFKKNDNQTYGLYFISQDMGNYVYFNRSLKFIRNNTSEQTDKQMLKIKLMLEQVYSAKTELYFISDDAVENASALGYVEDYPIIFLSKYDPGIWKDYNILSPVQAILEYQTD